MTLLDMVACWKLTSESGFVISASPVAMPWLNCPKATWMFARIFVF
jgi:hypothetical protein